MELPLSQGELTRHTLPGDLIHDLRTPLNQIIGYSEMVLERGRELGDKELVPDLEKVCIAGHRLLQLITQSFVASGSHEANRHDAANGVMYQSPEQGFPCRQLKDEFEPSDANGSLLVVDDDEGNRDVLSRRLLMQGYAVANAQDGRQAIEMLEADLYDLVLLDIMMPDIDGFEVLRRIKASDRLQHVPVIMISAFGEMDAVARCIEMGAEDYLTKPFNPTLLKARLGACLEKKRSRDREIQLFDSLQQNYKKLQELETLRDDLTNMIVHDLRTPLTSVMAAIETLDVVGDVNEDQREIMNIAVAGSGTLLTMINSLLDVEKLESGAMNLEYTFISLPELSASAIAQVTSLAQAKTITLTMEVSSELSRLYADESKLERILVNLLGNAIKFTPSGGFVTLYIHERDNGESVEFCVHDTGEGIPAEAFERIFQKFGQVHSRTAGRTMSTGLGLTFCKLAAEAHGGKIAVESSLSLGSTFCFTIPTSSPAP